MGFKEHLKERGAFTKAEDEVCDRLCDAINNDKDLKSYFSSFVTNLLRVFLSEMAHAQSEGDRKYAQEAAEKAGDKIRAIITYLYIKVPMNKEEVK